MVQSHRHPSKASPAPEQGQRAAIQDALLSWYAIHRRDLPWRGTSDPYAILIAEVMLQQTQVERVTPKYLEFLQRFPGFSSLARASTAQVLRLWAPLGYNLRALRLQRIAQRVVQQDGHLPETLPELQELPGVGAYTAAAFQCFALGRQVPVLDTNVRRVLSRLLWGVPQPKEKELSTLSRTLLPQGKAAEWNQALMDLGATVCRPRAPRCTTCPLHPFCQAAPLLQGGTAQAPPRRGGSRTAPFYGSSRYYRGRILQRLRMLPDGEGLPLLELGRAVKSDFTPQHLPWLRGLVAGLERDGLARTTGEDGATTISLP